MIQGIYDQQENKNKARQDAWPPYRLRDLCWAPSPRHLLQNNLCGEKHIVNEVTTLRGPQSLGCQDTHILFSFFSPQEFIPLLLCVGIGVKCWRSKDNPAQEEFPSS